MIVMKRFTVRGSRLLPEASVCGMHNVAKTLGPNPTYAASIKLTASSWACLMKPSSTAQSNDARRGTLIATFIGRRILYSSTRVSIGGHPVRSTALSPDDVLMGEKTSEYLPSPIFTSRMASTML